MSRLNIALKKAFASESKAYMIYIDFAKKAEQEGYKQVAKLFRAAAESEHIHAHNHLRAMGKVRTTVENLESTLKGEVNICKTAYSSMMEHAKNVGNKWAEKSFYYASEVEERNTSLFKQTLHDHHTHEERDYFICKVCGLIVEDEAPEKCSVCGSKKRAFKKIN